MAKEYKLEWVLNYTGSQEELIRDIQRQGYRFEVVSSKKRYDAAWDYNRRVFYIKPAAEGSKGKYSASKETLAHELMHAMQGKRGANYLSRNESDAYAVTFKYDPRMYDKIKVRNPFFFIYLGPSASLRDMAAITYPMAVIGSSSGVVN